MSTQNVNAPEMERRRVRSRGNRVAERLLFVALIVGVAAAVYYLKSPGAGAVPAPAEQMNNLKDFRKQVTDEFESRMNELRNEQKAKAEQLEALLKKPVPQDEEGKKKREEEIKALQDANAKLIKDMEDLKKSKKVMEDSIAQRSEQLEQQQQPQQQQQSGGVANNSGGESKPVVTDVPDPKRQGAGAGTEGGEGGGESRKGNGDVNPVAFAAAVAAAIFPGLGPVFAALGIGGDLFGTEYRDGKKVVETVREMYEKGAEVKVEAAVNKLTAETWGDPTGSIAKIRKALQHPEMRKKLGEAKAQELANRLDELETLFKSHPDLLKLVGREATLRLIKELPPILLAPSSARPFSASGCSWPLPRLPPPLTPWRRTP
jgi:hypothetical protein